jgi:hypothetical protein
MLDDLRQQTNIGFIEEETPLPEPPPPAYFLGMTPVQTFIITILVLFFACILSAVFLLVTGRVVPPFLY